MEGNHTSRTGVLSGVKNSGGQILDVRSWQGLTEVLKRARESGMNDEEYASFRDTVLEYAQSGGAETLRSKIESVVASFPPPETKKIEVTKERSPEVKQQEPAKPRSGFAGGRPTPHFTVAKEKETSSVPQKTSLPTKPKTEPAEPVLPRQQQEKVPVPASRTLPVQSVPDNLPTGTGEQRASSLPKAPQEKPASPPPPPPPKPAPEPEVKVTETAVSPPPPSHTLTESKARIAAIKHEVNTKIGNPGTLIDNGNAIGRDYMSALLSAMKASAGGSAEDLDVAMARLEKSYELVMQFADKMQKKAPAPPPPPPPKPAPEPPPKPEPKKPAEQLTQEKPAPAVTEADVTSFEEKKRESFANIKKIVAATKLTGDEEEASKQQEEITKTIVKEEKSPEETPPPPPPQPEVKPDRELPGEKESVPVYHTAPSPRVGSIPSLADRLKGLVPEVTDAVESGYSDQPVTSNTFVKPVQGISSSHLSSGVERNTPPQAPETPHINPAALNKNTPSVPDITNEPQRVREYQDDLFSEKVTNALEQLLDEWNLFRKSGILGIGPSGIHHPLYVKLKDLTMFSVTSGRFEGSTPDIRQSLMDYVNAWRYEQGVAFSPTESFEHYLRRVIARILKRRGS